MSKRSIDLLIVRRAGDGLSAPVSVSVSVGSKATLAEVLTELAGSGTLDEWPASCGDGTCGACGVVVDGKPVLACKTRMADLDSPVTVAPLTKLPGAGDLLADRRPLREVFERAGISLRPGEASPFDPDDDDPLARCIGCGLCMEACPQFGPGRAYIGPAALAQAARVMRRGTNGAQALAVAAGQGGASDCANAQACVDACPQDLPLLDALGLVKRRVTLAWLRDVFGG